MAGRDDEAVILVRGAGESWQEPAMIGYLSEADMQQMLAEQPSLIPGVGPDAVAAREFSTGVGPSDVVVVDQDGSVTVVECKLASNVEIRRKIVGQVLDYASRLWQMPLTDFEARWKQCSGGSGVLDLLDEQASSGLASALNDGAFRLVLAVDSINEDLRRIVEFLNAHTSEQVTVLALELRRVSHAGVDILTPRTFGGELARAKQDKAVRAGRAAWSLEDVRDALAASAPSLAAAYERLRQDALSLGCLAEGTAAAEPSMTFKFTDASGNTSWPFAVYCGATPRLYVNFEYVVRGTNLRQAFFEAVGDLGGALDVAAIQQANLNKRPGVPLAVLLEQEHYNAVLASLRVVTDSAVPR